MTASRAGGTWELTELGTAMGCVQHQRQGLGVGAGAKEAIAGQKFVEHHPDRKKIGAAV